MYKVDKRGGPVGWLRAWHAGDTPPVAPTGRASPAEPEGIAMGWVWALAVLAVLIGAGVLIDHRRYRGVPIPPGLTGRAKRRAKRRAKGQVRAALSRYQTPPRDTGYQPDPGGGGAG